MSNCVQQSGVLMVRFAHRDSGAAVYSDDDDALDYLELNSSGDTCVRLRRATLFRLMIGNKMDESSVPWKAKAAKQDPSTRSAGAGNTCTRTCTRPAIALDPEFLETSGDLDSGTQKGLRGPPRTTGPPP